ncbi:MAG: DUF2095 family protein [Candidatus Thorarchaeota archaeon]|nr:DUF2095 family protein [Candidatus Thorarchaeota archaeon]
MSNDDEFRRNYPNLTRELESGSTLEHKIDGVRTMSEEAGDEAAGDGTFLPSVVDYIRRCDTVPQAMEIVDYMINRGELPAGQGRQIKAQLKTEGLRSFGAKKEKDHYLHHGLE